MKFEIKGNDILKKEDLFEAFKQVLTDDEFANNLDALHDVLTEKDEEITVEVINPYELADNLSERYTMAFIQMLLDSSITVVLKQIEE